MLQVEEPSSGAGMPSGAPGDEEGYQLIKIHVPELNVQKCLQFSRDQLVWDVKQQCLASLPKELKESFNYGLFSPPVNGKAGKFLDEERRLGDYPFSGPVGYLELKYKRRVYKMMSLDEKQLKSLHTRANLRRLLDYVQNGQVEKITKVCSKGLDPNFHCQDSGETPLTIAATVKKPAKVLIALVNGGALLDYRTRDGSTAMHRAVEKNSLESVRTLLELGASPNYRDSKGLTPLYHCITTGADPAITETLLHDHATIGAQDLHGWQEVHQACKNGLRQHLEHLLFYGADMNARNASGNTPLHMCAVNGQEPCARQLLFRGADRDALNYANQTPYQVAVIAGNLDLAELIQNYRPEDVVPFRGPPSYNPKRRSGFGFGWLPRAPSERCLILPPSPCPSDRSSAPTTFSSASDSLSGSEGSSHHGVPHGHETDTASIVTVLALGVADKSLGDTSDIISDSSGVGTANSDTTNCSLSMPGTTVVCIENYSSNLQGHLRISEGDIIEVTGATDCGLLEGTLRGPGQHSGLFPAQCVQEVRLRHGIPPPMMITARDRPPSRVVGRRETITKHFATAPRVKKTLPAEPRTVVLHRARKGFGFILRGAKATSPLMELTPSEKCPALQYLDDVDKGGVADMSGLKKGDFLLEINGEDVSSASHEHVVDLIRKSGDLVSMTVVSLGPPQVPGMLPTSKSAAALPAGASNGNGPMDVPLNRQCATLPRKLPNSQSGNLGTLGKARAPMPPRRDPKTTLSVGRARAKSMVAGLEGGGEKEDLEDMTTAKSSSAESIHQQVTPGGTCTSTPVQPRTASIRARPTSSRITAAELEELFQRQQDGTARASGMMTTSHFQGPPASPAKGKVYASVAEMKRSKGKSNSRSVRFFNTLRRGSAFVPVSGELHRDFHSTPDLAHQLAQADALAVGKGHRSQEDVTLLLGATRPAPLPPPSHPPPPPPIGQVVKVDVSRASKSEYDSIAAKGEQLIHDEGVMSSFRPAASAKLYASPEDMKTVGYRSRSLPSHSARPQVRKSHSLRTNASSFKPPTATTMPAAMSATLPKNSGGSNPYAQPIRASRSHSTAGVRERKKQRLLNSNPGGLTQSGGPPPIPEPDYSLSESEMESEEERETKDLEKGVQRLNIAQQPVETSGNSNTSGSSSGSGSMQHSFSVDEIQKVRTQLKSSKSYPNDFLLKQKKQEEALPEDCDNSSSGVSSDQEIPVGPPSTFDDRLSGANNQEHQFKSQNSASQTQTQTGTLRNVHHNQRVRNAVSLAQLPPPIEADTDEKEDIFVPPPPEFEGGPSGGAVPADAVVLAPPPQFSDHRQTRVRIVGAVPKSGPATSAKSGRLHSQ